MKYLKKFTRCIVYFTVGIFHLLGIEFLGNSIFNGYNVAIPLWMLAIGVAGFGVVTLAKGILNENKK